ncbi:MAG: S41 family peptidase [Bacteroidales bacterium]|jgi:hypothetical protein|nr:S41 family peptidase [Bacteroidales bacterium]
MRRIIVFFLVVFAITQMSGQSSVTFRVDMENLMTEGLFSSDSGDRIFIRGSFNDWKGSMYELKKSPVIPNLYCGTFEFENIGDTLFFKYILHKEADRAFWESNPDPDNPDNGNRSLIVRDEEMMLPPATFCYDEYITFPVLFSKKQLEEDFLQFRNILESTHPALYDYTNKEVLDSIFDHNYERIGLNLEFTDFLMLMTEVISKVGCGHSSLWVPGKFWNVAPGKLFPYELYISGDQVLVKGVMDGTREIPPGSELLSINNQPVQQIIQRLASLTSADGFNSSYRKTKVAQNFAVKYALAFGFPDNFMVEYIAPGNLQHSHKTIRPVSKNVIDSNKSRQSELSFREIPGMNTGVLTINTFGYYGRVEMFRNFMDSVFTVISQEGIGDLILDLRGNSGGDPFCASYLWAYLEPGPLPYFKDHYGKYDTLANPVPQPGYHYKGDLYTLIDGNGFSTTGHFCALLDYHNVGSFVGSELGSTYTCTGNATYPPLKNTGIMVGTARVRRYTAAVEDMDAMCGVMPDYPVEIGPGDIIEGRDAVMEYALSLINNTRDSKQN